MNAQFQVKLADLDHGSIRVEPALPADGVVAPKGGENLPMVVIIHGGGWSSNNEDVMRALAWE